jgi:hypothetical protein
VTIHPLDLTYATAVTVTVYPCGADETGKKKCAPVPQTAAAPLAYATTFTFDKLTMSDGSRVVEADVAVASPALRDRTQREGKSLHCSLPLP